MNTYHFTYEGSISEDLNVSLGHSLKTTLELNVPLVTKIQRMVSFALEMLDNSLRYSSDKKVEFHWYAKENDLVITVKNFSSAEDAKKLKRTVEYVSKLNSEQVQEEYMRIMRNEEFNEKGGAGLGILHMTKHGAKKIHVEIEGNDDAVTCTCQIVAPMTIKQLETINIK